MTAGGREALTEQWWKGGEYLAAAPRPGLTFAVRAYTRGRFFLEVGQQPCSLARRRRDPQQPSK
jgi:hypothetical protein